MRHLALVMALAVVADVPAPSAQSWQPPADDKRCPSRWGAGDERGSANPMKPEAVLRATRAIKTGEVVGAT